MDEQLVTHVEELLEELGDQPTVSDNQEAICSSNDEMELT